MWRPTGGKGLGSPKIFFMTCGLRRYSETVDFLTRWWFQRFFIFTPIWGRFQFWLNFLRWVETTNQLRLQSQTPSKNFDILEFMLNWFSLIFQCSFPKFMFTSNLNPAQYHFQHLIAAKKACFICVFSHWHVTSGGVYSTNQPRCFQRSNQPSCHYLDVPLEVRINGL